MVSSHGNTSDTSIYRYTSARESTAAPAFPAGAKVTVDEVTENSAKVHFPAARAGGATKVYQSAGNGGYRYALSEGDYDAFRAASTLEVMFKTSSNIQDEQAIFSNQQSAGAGLECSKGNLEYWYRNAKNNSYVHVKAPLEAQRWIRAAAVADGKEVTLYVDGKKCDAAAATGMVIPGPKYYYVGCDTNSDGNPEFLTKSVIALLILAHHATSHQHVAIVACWWLCLAGITHWMKKGLSALPRK